MLEYLANLFNPQRAFFQPPDQPIVREDSMVVAFHPRLVEIGQAILDSGGNAFDAFVAVASAQNVIGEGASTLAGPLGVLLRTAPPGTLAYLDADLNDPLDPDWEWKPGMPADGRTVLVPGAPAGLEALALKYGTRPFGELLQPALQLAEEGFPVTRLLSTFISWRASVLKRSDYGRRTYFSADGKPLKAGQTLRLPEVASFLSNLAAKGSAYVYDGEWGRQFLDVVQRSHGVLTQRDLVAYRVQSHAPRTTSYRGYRLCANSGHAYGGVWTLLALKTLEHTTLPQGRHYSTDPDQLELLVKIAREVWAERWILDHQVLDDPAQVTSRLTSDYAAQIWDRVAQHAGPSVPAATGQHSYHIIIVDQAGNVASGTTTIEADPWGEGIFVEGIPLSTAGMLPLSTAPGHRRLSPLSIHFGFQDNELSFSLGSISNSVAEAAFQMIVNLVDYQLPIEQVVSLPRFGSFPVKRNIDLGKNWLDPRISGQIVKQLRKRGLKFERGGIIDTGLGSIVSVDSDGNLRGIASPLPYIAQPFATNT